MALKTLSVIYGLCIVTMLKASGEMLLTDQISQMSITDKIIGPFGALVLSLAGLWVASKLIIFLHKRNQELTNQRMKEKDDFIRYLREQNKRLRGNGNTG